MPVTSSRGVASVARRLAVPLLFSLLALAFVGPALLPGRALLPIDNLFQFPPWRAYADDFGVRLPHNPLISDAILQNYSWKRLARESLARGELPLWNPYILGGQPFMASGQNGALYPLGALFYVLPVAQAYGWFIALHLWLGAMAAYLFARALGATRLGGVIAGVTFGFCGYLVVSFLWPMVVSTAVWLPALLTIIEVTVTRRGPRPGWHGAQPATSAGPPPVVPVRVASPGREAADTHPGAGDAQLWPARQIPVALLIAVGALVVGLQFLAGHLEMSLYLLLTSGLYTALRLVGRLRTDGLGRTFETGLAALTMVALGTGLAAILLVPFSEVIGANVRTGWSDYEETVGYALPRERAIGWLVPDLFGNPTHHTYVDVFDREVHSVEHTRPNGEPRTDTEWGGKNYVEGTAYVGILPLLLALIALVALARRPTGGAAALAVLALISVLLAFGTPLYAVLFYSIPGVNQLHTPFRWIYPLSLCLAVLAGLGASRVWPARPVLEGVKADLGHRRSRTLVAVIGGLALVLGLAGLLAVIAAIILPETSLALAARALRRWSELRQGFDQPRVLLSYELLNVARAAVLLLAGGLLLWLAARPPWPTGRHTADDGSSGHYPVIPSAARDLPGWAGRSFAALRMTILKPNRGGVLGVAAVVLLIVDLFTFGIGFNTVADTRPLAFTPRSIQAIQADPDLFRIVTLGEDDTLPANTNMLFGLQDVRGYDTIILREYVEYLELIEPQRGIPYSKVAKLFDDRSLDSPLLDLLNVKYVLTSKRVSRPGWSLAYEGEGIRVYRNDRVIPRAFLVADARYVEDRAAALRAVGDRSFDPRRTVVLEPGAGAPSAGRSANAEPQARSGAPATEPSAVGGPPATGPTAGPSASAGSPAGLSTPAALSPLVPAHVVEYGPNRVVVQVSAPSAGVLVLGDVFFPGWRATVDGVRQPVLRANAVLRGVELSPGEHTVVFEYRPFSVQVGAFISALSALSIGLLGGYALLGSRYSRSAPTGGRHSEPIGSVDAERHDHLDAEPTGALRRVARNSAFPMASSLLNKGIDIAFALVMFRILQAESVGAYTFAGVLVGYLDTLVGFGLVTLITRDVARDHALAGRYLGSTLVVRLGLWLGSAALTALLVGPLAGLLDIDGPLALTLWLLILGLLPGIVSSTVSALFMAHEEMEYPAVVTVLTTLLKVALGLSALLAGWGYVGLAGVSVATNLVTMVVLLGLYARTIGLPWPSVDLRFGVRALDAAFPLMINSFLNALFFKVDAILLKPLAGDLALGWYSTAYKFIDGLQVIPSSFILAVFPLLSRHAHTDRARLSAVVTTALKVLLVLAFPIAVGTTILADWIILLFAGRGYLPQSSTALQLLIWYLPLSFVNGLTQYLLIALDRTRTITLGFALGLAFNLAANLLLIPTYGYLGASAVTIASEAVLLVPFWWVVRRELPSLSLVGVAWRPALAALVMAGPVWLANGWSPLLAVPIGALVYAATLLALGTFDAEERRAALGLLRRRDTPAALAEEGIG